jgi:hypothetical protein
VLGIQKMIEESLKNLNPLESFNKNAFIADEKYEQELCNFILALALVWNDTKNLLLYYEYLKSLEPLDVSKVEDLKQLHPNCRHAWEIIVSVSLGGVKDKDPLGQALLRIRHKVANHYDKNELLKGYKRKFLSQKNIPFISRGESMMKRRFYFADAAAQEYQRLYAERVEFDKFYEFINLIKNSINLSIQNIVETFIQQRYGWREI